MTQVFIGYLNSCLKKICVDFEPTIAIFSKMTHSTLLPSSTDTNYDPPSTIFNIFINI
jgi:hypothetical protein